MDIRSQEKDHNDGKTEDVIEMVKINLPNGYIISVIQSTLGAGMMLECAVWHVGDKAGKWIKIPGIDMHFMDENDLIRLIKKVQKFPRKPGVR